MGTAYAQQWDPSGGVSAEGMIAAIVPPVLIFFIIGLVIGFITSRIDKTLGVRTCLFAGALGGGSGGIGMYMWGVGKIRGEVLAVLIIVGAVLGSLIFLFATHLSKNRSSAISPADSRNFSDPPIFRFCTQCGTRLKAGLRFCPSCGSAAEQ